MCAPPHVDLTRPLAAAMRRGAVLVEDLKLTFAGEKRVREQKKNGPTMGVGGRAHGHWGTHVVCIWPRFRHLMCPIVTMDELYECI